MKRLFVVATAILGFNVWAAATPKRLRAWHGQHQNKNDSCALVFSSPRVFIANLIEIPDEFEFNEEVSVYTNGDLNDFLTYGPNEGMNWANAGLSFDLTKQGFELLKNGVPIKYFKFTEPIADIRFISDSQLNGGNKGKGYISIVGWTETRYFRLDSAAGKGFTLKNIDRDAYALAVGHLSPTSASNTSLFAGVDNGLVALGERPTKLNNVVGLPSVLREDEAGIQEYVQLTHLNQHERTPSVLRYAIGNLGGLILENLKRVSQGQEANWSIPGYPTLLLRLAAKALIRDPDLRADLAYLLMTKDQNQSPETVSLEQLEATLASMKLADYSLEATKETSKNLMGEATLPAFKAKDRQSNRYMQIEIAINPLKQKDFIHIR